MNNIGVDYIDKGIRFKFLNGSILLPYKYGGYVIAPGCGAGKTTAIKDLIRQKYSKGILYTASTIDECNLMYEYCKELVSEVNDPKKLTLEDIAFITHESSNWKSNLDSLSDKKIIICDNRILTESHDTILAISSTRFRVNDFDLGELALGELPEGDSYFPREFVILDDIRSSDLNPVEFCTKDHSGRSYLISILTNYTEQDLYEFKNSLGWMVGVIREPYENSFMFKFPDLPEVDFPKLWESGVTGKKFSLESTLSKSPWGRTYQLTHRSHQAKLMDSLIDLDYFSLVGVKSSILKEFPILTKGELGSTYLLLDYFIPDKSLAIELDSNLHDEDSDRTRDEFLLKNGIAVLRINNLDSNTKDKVEELVRIIDNYEGIPFMNSKLYDQSFHSELGIRSRSYQEFLDSFYNKYNISYE